MPREMALLITCEHGGNDVPPALAQHFEGLDDLLASHRGFDIGALEVAQRFAAALDAPLRFSTVTRLLVDLNRSPDAPDVFGSMIQALPAAERTRILEQYHTPHRRQIADAVATGIECGRRVLHIGVHSFTDVLDGVTRDLDLGLLFDPARSLERQIAGRWLTALRHTRPQWRHRFNQPYHGTDDGLTTWLRTRFADDVYAGIEIELRQGLLTSPAAQVDAADLLAGRCGRCLPTPDLLRCQRPAGPVYPSDVAFGSIARKP